MTHIGCQATDTSRKWLKMRVQEVAQTLILCRTSKSNFCVFENKIKLVMKLILNGKRYVQIPVAKRMKCFFKNKYILSSEQNERLFNFLNTRFVSDLRLVCAICGDPRSRYNVAPYTKLHQPDPPVVR